MPLEMRPYSRLLLVEDDASQRNVLAEILRDEGFDVIACSTATEALQSFAHHQFKVAIVDLRLPDLIGTRLLERIKLRDERVRVIIHTADGCFESARDAVNLGAFAYVEKMGDPRELVKQVHRAIRDYFARYTADLEAAVEDRTVELRASERRYRQIVETAEEGILLLDQDGRIAFANQRLAEMLGTGVNSLRGRTPATFADVDWQAQAAGKFGQRQPGTREQYDFKFCRSDGTALWAIVSATSLTNSEGSFNGALMMLTDITERKKAEESLLNVARGVSAQTGETFFRSLVEHLGRTLNADDAFVGELIPEKPGFIRTVAVFADGQICENFEFALAETPCASIIGRVTSCFADNVQQQFPRDPMLQRMRTQAFVGTPLFDSDGRPSGLMVVSYRLPIQNTRLAESMLRIFAIRAAAELQRIRAEAALRASEEKFRMLAETIPASVSIFQGKRLRYANPAMVQLTGYTQEELLTQHFLQMVHPDFRNIVRERGIARQRGEGVTARYEMKVVRKDGQERWIDFAAGLIEYEGEPAVLGTALDITQRKRSEEERLALEAQIRSSQKLESLGKLAGGIAHDFNNLLMGILGHASLALMDLAGTPPLKEHIEKIETSAQRAAGLCQQLLAYSGRGRFVVEPVNLNAAISEMVHLLETVLSKRAELQFHLHEQLPLIEADSSQIGQILMNLLTNASDALDENYGLISITTSVVDADREYLSRTDINDNLPEGQYVVVEVSDTGCGMDEATRSRIFDPFFTTKFTGRGLGLASVLGIVRGHGGAVQVDSSLRRGTTFRVLFPAIGHVTPTIMPAAAPVRQPLQGKGRILVIDDEEAVRNVIRMSLERAGFEVLTAENGRAGIELFRTHQLGISAVLLDMTMPELNGKDTLRELRKLRTDVPVVLSSGFDEQNATRDLVEMHPNGFLQKPYRPHLLIEKMSSVMSCNSPLAD